MASVTQQADGTKMKLLMSTATCVVALLSFGALTFSTAAIAAAKAKTEQSAKSKECSAQADAKGLHGKIRKSFRAKCKRGTATQRIPMCMCLVAYVVTSTRRLTTMGGRRVRCVPTLGRRKHSEVSKSAQFSVWPISLLVSHLAPEPLHRFGTNGTWAALL